MFVAEPVKDFDFPVEVHSKYADWKFIEEHKAITQEAA